MGDGRMQGGREEGDAFREAVSNYSLHSIKCKILPSAPLWKRTSVVAKSMDSRAGVPGFTPFNPWASYLITTPLPAPAPCLGFLSCAIN